MQESVLDKFMETDQGGMSVSDSPPVMLELDAGTAGRRAIGYGHLREVLLHDDAVELRFSTGTFCVYCSDPTRAFEAVASQTARAFRVSEEEPKRGIWVRAIRDGGHVEQTPSLKTLRGN